MWTPVLVATPEGTANLTPDCAKVHASLNRSGRIALAFRAFIGSEELKVRISTKVATLLSFITILVFSNSQSLEVDECDNNYGICVGYIDNLFALRNGEVYVRLSNRLVPDFFYGRPVCTSPKGWSLHYHIGQDNESRPQIFSMLLAAKMGNMPVSIRSDTEDCQIYTVQIVE